VREAVQLCYNAGIRVIMITGDYPNTARAIAQSIGLMKRRKGVLTGAELDKLDAAQLREAIRDTSVFARVSPEHKMRIVDALQANNEIVAMTGDGVNDAPAIKRSDIGVAMGITGTDVAKQTADMVLTDDNYASIVSAVEQGRIIYSNIRKFVFFLLSSNVAEIMIIFLATLAGLPAPLTAIQLLWLNLITDGAPALALAMEKGDPDIMDQKPRAVFQSAPTYPAAMRGKKVEGVVTVVFVVDAVDAYCEDIAFSAEQCGRVFAAARALGLPVRLHSEQLSNVGGSQVAALHGALSCDHLEYANEADAAALARSGTVAVLLPVAWYALAEKQLPPVAALRANGVPIAIATDCNPGSAPCASLLLAMNMARRLFGLTSEEVLSGVTRNAARALGMQAERGSIEPGRVADFAVWSVDSPDELGYWAGFNPCSMVVKAGEIALERPV
jgi:soluble P-type ATPase